MNLIEISNELKINFTHILNNTPINKIDSIHIEEFIRFYKILFLKMYKQFGLTYASILTLNIGLELINQMSNITNDVTFSLELEHLTRSILENMDLEGKIDYSKQSAGIYGEFYDSLTEKEKKVYISTLFDNLIGPKNHLVISVSKACLKLNIGFDEYFNVTSSIIKKQQLWYDNAKKDIIGNQIKF